VIFSRRAALVVGILAPLGETIRKWGEWGYLPSFFDDYLIGALLLHAWWSGKRIWLAGAWGFTCGMAYASFFGHLRDLQRPDPAPIPHVWVTAIIGTGFLISIAAWIATLRDHD
jgi:hypothetical protein